MLCQFSFKNFKSYREETTIELQAENIGEFKETLIDSDKDSNKYLPIISIYGPNGSGKTNAIEALAILISTILRPVKLLNNNLSKDILPILPYKFTDNIEPTEFEIYYRVEKEEFRYNINFINNSIIYESLFVLTENAKKPTKIFVRVNNSIDIGDILKKEKIKINNNNNLDIPFLSFLSIFYDIPIIKKAFDFFDNTLLINFNYINYEEIPLEMLKDEDIKLEFLNILGLMDIDIKDYRIEKVANSDNSYNIFTKHLINNKEYELDFTDESNGTQKLFLLLPAMICSLKSGALTVIDEMDAKLHPKLIEYILGLYKNKNINTKGAQLIVTSHDLTTLNKDIFRRDEILFAAKNKNDSSDLYSLYEIRDENGEHIRSTSSYNKQYIEGRYGADPYLQQIKSWEV